MSHNHLDTLNTIKLADYVRAHFTKSEETDQVFAKTATQALGFSVTGNNIRSLREALNIPANGTTGRPRASIAQAGGLTTVIEHLLDRMAKLEAGLGQTPGPANLSEAAEKASA